MMNSTRLSPLRAPARPLHQLRGALGNQAFGRVIQAKLQISRPGDEYEREADRVADQVMRMPEPQLQRACPSGGGYPKCQTKQPSQEHERLQTKRVQAGDTGQIAAPPIVHDLLAEPGQPLDPATRGFMEPRFGCDFNDVRVHADAGADVAAAAVGARAFTVGADVVFRRGEFVPHTQAGRALLAHELAHVAQGPSRQPQLFRKEAIEPHYPTEDEQREIEKILSREFKETAATEPAPPGEPAKERGTPLNEEQRRKLAGELKQPYLDTLDRLDSGSGSSDSALDETEAFEVLTQAREDIYKRFGDYAKRITLTREDVKTPAERRKAKQVFVQFSIDPSVTRDLARTIATTDCKTCLTKLAPLNQGSRKAVIDTLIEFGFAVEGGAKLRRALAKKVPGGFSHGLERLSLALRPREELRHTALHELMHALVHPVFRAAFGDEDYINEGFTEYFTQEIVGSVNPSYKNQYEKVISVRDAMQGPFHFVGNEGAEESMRLAYFRGRLDLIGWRPSGPDEEQAVKNAAKETVKEGFDPIEAGEPKQWDAATASRYAKIYQAEAQAKQAASRNVLGVGLYFTKDAADTIAVRYARVIARTEPYAKGQLLLEGQLLGSPVQNPSRLGASFGIGAEYQEPYFYAQAGVRFVGTAAPAGGANRLDVSPFAGLGIRAWQTIRVGVEGYLAVPVLKGQDRLYGGIVTLGVEL